MKIRRFLLIVVCLLSFTFLSADEALWKDTSPDHALQLSSSGAALTVPAGWNCWRAEASDGDSYTIARAVPHGFTLMTARVRDLYQILSEEAKKNTDRSAFDAFMKDEGYAILGVFSEIDETGRETDDEALGHAVFRVCKGSVSRDGQDIMHACKAVLSSGGFLYEFLFLTDADTSFSSPDFFTFLSIVSSLEFPEKES